MAKASYPGPADRLAQYEAVVDEHPDIERKGAKNPYTSRNGHMFSYLDTEGTLCIRLGKDEHAEFLDAYDSEVPESHGAKMKEYVTMPANMLDDTAVALEWLTRSYDYIGTLKPKPTTKKKK